MSASSSTSPAPVIVSEAIAEAQAEEVLVLREIFGEDVAVQSEEVGEIVFTLQVYVDLGVGSESVTLRAETSAEAVSSAVDGSTRAEAAAEAGSQLSVAELVEQRLKGAAPTAVQPVLERSVSGARSRAEASVKHLPPIRLQVSFPPAYPDAAAPDFDLSCAWLASSQLAQLCARLDEVAEEMPGSPVVFTWAEALRNETAAVLGFDSVVSLEVSDEATDVRAVSHCVDPMATLTELLQYDQRREREVWRNQVHTCMICFTEKAGSLFAQCGGCVHAFCVECMSEMARVHVTDGTIVELKCPLPDCRAEMSGRALERVLDEETYERWVRLKTQQILTSELKDVVFCPRCEEMGIDVPVVVAPVKFEDEVPVAQCTRCDYLFCGKCLGVAHSKLSDCISEEDRMLQVAIRKADGGTRSAADRRRSKRAQEGKMHEIGPGDDVPKIDILGTVSEDCGPISEGDEIFAVGVGTKDCYDLVWCKRDHKMDLLEAALENEPPIVVRYKATSASAGDRERKKKVLEELLTLRAIKQDSMACPRCKVRISRSAGCNHMRCTHCDTHFCYRCGRTLNPDTPYDHFRTGGCPTFDQEEVQRIAVQEREVRRGGDDHELAALRREFGDQEALFDQFRQNPARGHFTRQAFQERHRDDTQCPTCRQWNQRNGRLNAARCHACRTPYCHHCRKRIVGVVSAHFRGAGACPQHHDGQLEG